MGLASLWSSKCGAAWGKATKVIGAAVGLPEPTVAAILTNRAETFPQVLVDEAWDPWSGNAGRP